MPTDELCPFCEIVAGRAPATIQAEVRSLGTRVIIIEPLNPVVKGHLLAIPAEHVEDASADREVTGRTFAAAASFAKAPCNLITSSGTLATQSVRHLHVHIVPRHLDDGLMLPWGDNSRQSREYRDNAYAFYNGTEVSAEGEHSSTWCDICEADYGGGSHYHCGQCHSKDVTSMLGHYSFGKVVCDPDERAAWIQENVEKFGSKR